MSGGSDKITFIVQARSGSTRLPGKILLPFWQGRSILQLLLEKLRGIPDTQLIVATTTNPLDDTVAQLAQAEGVKVFRGSENDVLQRFIDAAVACDAKRIIRVCSDNPFLDVESIKLLISTANANPQADYISFDVNGTPSIKTHYGFWTEYVTLDALQRVCDLSNEPLYHEHVTNYIYSHPLIFDIKWIEGAGEPLKDLPIRLTIDTPTDMANAQAIYSNLVSKSGDWPNIAQVVDCLKDQTKILDDMLSQIIKNSK